LRDKSGESVPSYLACQVSCTSFHAEPHQRFLPTHVAEWREGARAEMNVLLGGGRQGRGGGAGKGGGGGAGKGAQGAKKGQPAKKALHPKP
jgi:hypothetical protein